MNTHSVLIIDDDPDICDFIATVAEDCGLEPTVVGEPERFRDEYRHCKPGMVVTDLQMPRIDGIEIMRCLAEEHSKSKILLLSGFDPKVIASAKKLGASLGLDVLATLQKPVSVSALKAQFEAAKITSSEPTVEDLKNAVAKGEIEVTYQPKVRIHGDDAGRVVGFEALARWPHPNFGMVSPGVFIPMVEQSGLISPFTDLVLDQTLAQLARWRAEGHDFQVAVNLSTLSLGDLSLPDRIARKVRESGCDPSHVILEITESAAMEDVSRCMDILTRFRLKGFELSIDDFGTGYSSLVQLYQMPFSELKIDKSFVLEVEDNEQARVIVKALINLAHDLSLPVCAEGIESARAWRFLDSLGCEKAQGFFMSKPLAAGDVGGWLDAWNNRDSSTLELCAG